MSNKKNPWLSSSKREWKKNWVTRDKKAELRARAQDVCSDKVKTEQTKSTMYAQNSQYLLASNRGNKRK